MVLPFLSFATDPFALTSVAKAMEVKKRRRAGPSFHPHPLFNRLDDIQIKN